MWASKLLKEPFHPATHDASISNKLHDFFLHDILVSVAELDGVRLTSRRPGA